MEPKLFLLVEYVHDQGDFLAITNRIPIHDTIIFIFLFFLTNISHMSNININVQLGGLATIMQIEDSMITPRRRRLSMWQWKLAALLVTKRHMTYVISMFGVKNIIHISSENYSHNHNGVKWKGNIPTGKTRKTQTRQHGT